ncbi:MAG: type II toxin-antitoxin system HicB family antitoxin [Devosia sp.]
MERYLAIIDEADGMFGVVFPDAPGCVAMGETVEEAILNAGAALSEWMGDWLADGNPQPEARGYSTILRSGEYPQLGQGGGLVATVPLVRETGKLARANISLDAGLLTAIDVEAARRGVTRSAFLAAAARTTILSGV